MLFAGVEVYCAGKLVLVVACWFAAAWLGWFVVGFLGTLALRGVGIIQFLVAVWWWGVLGWWWGVLRIRWDWVRGAGVGSVSVFSRWLFGCVGGWGGVVSVGFWVRGGVCGCLPRWVWCLAGLECLLWGWCNIGSCRVSVCGVLVGFECGCGCGVLRLVVF